MCIIVCLSLQASYLAFSACFVSWDVDFTGYINPGPLPSGLGRFGQLATLGGDQRVGGERGQGIYSPSSFPAGPWFDTGCLSLPKTTALTWFW